MKALSVQQPWAWLIVNGYKDCENRSWPTNVRGRIAIHAGKRFDREGYDYLRSHIGVLPMPAPLPQPDAFERGGIVGTVVISACVTNPAESPWFFGPFGFMLRDAVPLAFEPCRGQLGFFDWNPPMSWTSDAAAAVARALNAAKTTTKTTAQESPDA